MTCGHCEMSVREEVGEIPGVRSVEVSHESGALRVRSEQPVQDAAVLAAVAEAGYSAVRA
ncbi:heavy-metal-associated domain-containing protein [Brachybacterium sp. UNK5269]|uniref:heavy-metal-associated domain-containing protein n=1 Tax=Brachybacterium sp. UNK5269 TaxID=3408576 RepID=UPI003BB17B69